MTMKMKITITSNEFEKAYNEAIRRAEKEWNVAEDGEGYEDIEDWAGDLLDWCITEFLNILGFEIED